jgi:hypothetical protein
MADGVAVTGSTTLATFNTEDGAGTCGGSSTSEDVWFKYRPTTSGTVVFSTCGSGYDTVISLHSACGVAATTCNDDHGQGAAFCSANLASRISANLVAGTTYYIRVAGYNGAQGDYTLTATGGGGVVPPTNDNCSGRAGLGLGDQPFSLVGASTDGPAHAGSTVQNDIWYNHPGLCTGNLSIKVCGATGFTPAVAVYSGLGCDNLASRFLGYGTPVADPACPGAIEYVVNGLTAGTPVTVRVGSTSAAQSGTATLRLTCLPAGPVCNDLDFNNDGLFPDDADLVEFLTVLSGGACSTGDCDSIDFNNDGLFPDDNDLVTFLRVLAGGEC